MWKNPERAIDPRRGGHEEEEEKKREKTLEDERGFQKKKKRKGGAQKSLLVEGKTKDIQMGLRVRLRTSWWDEPLLVERVPRWPQSEKSEAQREA